MGSLEAIVISIMDDGVVLQIKDTCQEIVWPFSNSNIRVAVGESFTVQLKPTPTQMINNIVATTKNLHPETNTQKTDAMQKMLEALIN